jgi:hypothetical protein
MQRDQANGQQFQASPRHAPPLPRSGLVQSILLPAGNRIESTVRYLGIEVDDALELAEQTEV